MGNDNKVIRLLAEISNFRKEEKIIYDIIALYEHLENGEIDQSVVGTLLVEKLFHDWESFNGHISYKSEKGIVDIHEKLIAKESDICKRYQKYHECKEILDKFCSFRHKETAVYYAFLKKEEYAKEPFNIINMIADRSTSWASIFLTSNINFRDRLEMFGDLLKESNVSFLGIWENKINPYKNKKEVAAKKSALVKAFTDGECSCYCVECLVEDLIEKNRYVTFHILNSHVLDLAQVEFIYSGSFECLDHVIITTPALIAHYEHTSSLFKSYYEKPEYQKLNSKIRENNDLVILNSLDFVSAYSQASAIDFLKWASFQITKDKAGMLGTLIYLAQKKDYAIHDDVRQKIYAAILSRSKDEKDLEFLKECAQLFMETSDYSEEYKRRKTEEENAYKELVQRSEIRKKLTTTLKAISASINNQVTSQAKVGEVKLALENKEK